MTDKQVIILSYILVLSIPLFAGLGVGLFFFAKYLIRREKQQDIEDRQSTAAIKKAISRKKRLVRFFITGCWVCWVLFVLMLVLTLRGRVDIDDIPAVWLYILVLPVFSLAVFGYDRSPSVVSNLRQEIRELEGAQSSMTEGKGL